MSTTVGANVGNGHHLKQLIILVIIMTAANVQTSFLDACRRNDLPAITEMFSTSQHQALLETRNYSSGWTCLHLASYYGAFDVASYLINDQVDVNLLDKTYRNETALHLACERGNVDIIDVLLLRPNSTALLLEAEQENKMTPIFYAIMSKSSATLEKLIAYGANLQHVDSRGMQPVHFAVASQSTAAVILKMTAKLGTCHCDGFAKTISHLAAENNFVQFLRDLPISLFNTSSLDFYGQNPACYAAINGSTQFAEQMLRNRWSISSGNCRYGPINEAITGPPLHTAAYHLQADYVQLLIDKGTADVRQLDSNEGTPAHALAMGAHLTAASRETVERILRKLDAKHEGIIQARDNLGRTAFLVAVASSSLQVAQFLVENLGAEAKAADRDGYLAVHLVQDQQLLIFLTTDPMKDFYDINARSTVDRLTPLLIAVKEKKHPNLIRHFLHHLKADKDAVNKDGQNALHIAVEVDYDQIIQVLLDAKVSVLAEDNASRTPLHYAIELGRTNIANKLIQCSQCRAELLTHRLNVTLDTPLHVAAAKNRTEISTELLLHGAGVGLALLLNAKRETPLHKAVGRSNVALVKLLLGIENSSLTVKMADAYGRTPLHVAALWCDDEQAIEMAESLLQQTMTADDEGQLLEMADRYQETALDIAVKHNCPKMVSFLLSRNETKSAACLKPNKMGLTPWQTAMAFNYELLAETIKTKKCFEQQNKVDDYDGDFGSSDLLCGKLPHIENGNISDGLSSIGSTRNLSCARGFQLKGSVVIKCNNAAQWTVGGYCEEMDQCNSEPVVPNGIISSPGSLHVNIRYQLACSKAYHLIGAGFVECDVDGKWTVLGYCEEMKCKDLPVVANGAVSSGSFGIGSVRKLTCNAGFEIKGGLGNIVCSYEGRWTVDSWCGPQNLARQDISLTQTSTASTTTIAMSQLITSQQIQLCSAAAGGNINSVQQLLSLGYLNINWRNPEEKHIRPFKEPIANWTALLGAVAGSQSKEIVQLLIDKGANVNARDAKYGRKPLFIAAWNKRLDLVQVLVNAGADPNAAQDQYGLTPLMEAAFHGQTEMVNFLLDHGADINVKVTAGGWQEYSALMLAAWVQNAEMVKLLKMRGAVPD